MKKPKPYWWLDGRRQNVIPWLHLILEGRKTHDEEADE